MEFVTSELSSHVVYKLLVAVVVPRPIALVTTVSRDGIANAAPFSFFNLLGSDPPVVGINVALHGDGTPKDTLANIELSTEFVVHLVDEALAERMNVCAIDFPFGISEIEETGLTTRPSQVVNAPILCEAPAYLECKLEQVVRIGNNEIILGRIVGFGIRDSALDLATMRVDTPELKLIGRMHGGGWYTRTNDLFNIDRIKYTDWEEGHKEISEDGG